MVLVPSYMGLELAKARMADLRAAARPTRPAGSKWSSRAPRRSRLWSLRWPAVAIEFTEWATEILARSYQAARRFNPQVSLRLRRASDGVEFALTEELVPSDALVTGDGFELHVEHGLEGIVDVVEPHDQLILRPPGSPERSVRE